MNSKATLSDLEREAYATQNLLALAVFVKLDQLYPTHQPYPIHPLEFEKRKERQT